MAHQNRFSAPLLYWKNSARLKWADGKVKALGVWFCIDCEESNNKKNILNNWRNKRLTLIGKIAVIKGSNCITSCLYILQQRHV